MKFALITGVSQGLGESVATFLLESQINVIGISRTANDQLEKVAEKYNVIYKHYPCDLSKEPDVEKMLNTVLQQLDNYKASKTYIINNAATIDPIKPTININSEELHYHFMINTITPMIILNTCISHYEMKSNKIIGVNITSGAANRPIFGWSAYSSSKASIDAYTKTLALEMEHLKVKHKVIGFNPGVMDTNMQEQIRSTDEHSFRDVEVFKSYKENNILKDTHIIAGVLGDILTDDVSIQNGKIYDVKNYI